MQITKKGSNYLTTDNQSFPTFGDAVGHCKRLAVAHYLGVIRNQLHEETGLIPRKLADALRDLSDAVGDIMEERPALLYDDARERREQSPLQIAA